MANDVDHSCSGEGSCPTCARLALQEKPQLVEFMAANRMPDCFEPSRALVVALAQMYVELRGRTMN